MNPAAGAVVSISADMTIFYRSVVDRLEMYLVFLWTGRYFQTYWTRQLYSFLTITSEITIIICDHC